MADSNVVINKIRIKKSNSSVLEGPFPIQTESDYVIVSDEDVTLTEKLKNMSPSTWKTSIPN